MREPPHTCFSLIRTLTCQGHFPSSASFPPKIFAITWPHPGVRTAWEEEPQRNRARASQESTRCPSDSKGVRPRPLRLQGRAAESPGPGPADLQGRMASGSDSTVGLHSSDPRGSPRLPPSTGSHSQASAPLEAPNARRHLGLVPPTGRVCQALGARGSRMVPQPSPRSRLGPRGRLPRTTRRWAPGRVEAARAHPAPHPARAGGAGPRAGGPRSRRPGTPWARPRSHGASCRGRWTGPRRRASGGNSGPSRQGPECETPRRRVHPGASLGSESR